MSLVHPLYAQAAASKSSKAEVKVKVRRLTPVDSYRLTNLNPDQPTNLVLQRKRPSDKLPTAKARDNLIHSNRIAFQKRLQDLIGATRLSAQTTKSKAKKMSKETPKAEAEASVDSSSAPAVSTNSELESKVMFTATIFLHNIEYCLQFCRVSRK